MPEQELIIEHLHRVFPNGVIYREEYTSSVVGAKVIPLIGLLARKAGKNYLQWLQENGFIFRETGYIEADMRSKEHSLQGNDAISIADYVFRSYPLAGQFNPSPEQREVVFLCAQSVFCKYLISGSRVTPEEEAILTLSAIELLKCWSPSAQTDDSSDSLWHYLFLQYGFNPENSESAEQRIYRRFCSAIKNTLNRYHRFFAPPETMVYYTSLFLHALAPQKSVDSLFNILFDFYAKNLDFQYVPDDTSYKRLVEGMQARWKEDASSDLHLRSDSVMSGLRVLFQSRPGYMAAVCDELVRKMDLLLRGEEVAPLDRWDELLLDWFRKKSNNERSNMQGKKRERRSEYVATTADRIFLKYVLQDEQVGLLLPCIRLPKVGETRAEVIILQGDREVVRRTLSVTGNDLCMTTKSAFIPLAETTADFSSTFELIGRIEYMGEVLYDSGRKLYRDYISFDSNGTERSVKSGTIYLFSGNTRDFYFENDGGVFCDSSHPGQLLRVNLSEVGFVTLDGSEIIADEFSAEKIRIYPKSKPKQGISVTDHGYTYSIFNQLPTIAVHFPQGENPKKYILSIDGRGQPLTDMVDQEIVIKPQRNDDQLHCIDILDLVKETIVCEFRFVILENLSIVPDRSLYLETEDFMGLMLTRGSVEVHTTAQRIEGTDKARVIAPFGDTDFEIDLPTVHCSFGNSSAFLLPEQFWWERINNSTFCRLSFPSAWTGALMLGANELPIGRDGSCEIGNLLRSGRKYQPSETLYLILRSQENEIRRELTTIVFEPQFFSEPLLFRDGSLVWSPSGCYVGPDDPQFRLEITGKTVSQVFDLDRSEKTFFSEGEFPHDRYSYRVFLKPRSLFSRDLALIHDGICVVGDENEFRFDGKEIHLRRAICWNGMTEKLETSEMKEKSSILEHFEFVGVTPPYQDDDAIKFPEYTAQLCFEHPDGRRIPFSSDENSDKYEWINPARVWVVSDTRVIVLCASGDSLYLDLEFHSIVGRHPELTMNRRAQLSRLRNPDYFDCEVKEV